jgi:DNA-directed RNA polymerase beta subunit
VRNLYHNMAQCYEDALVVNRKSVDRGMFDVESRPEYTLDHGVEVPTVGQAVNIGTHAWWKVPYEGIVTSVTVDGHGIRVQALYRAPLMTGDKLSTSHGQKGIAVIVDDMPLQE